MLSRNPPAALIGTRIERKTTINSSSNASPRTTAMYFGSAALSVSAVSMFTAVWPVT